MEKVSVIIPAYNVEKFIGECVESVLAQTYTNIEIIVVDDGSSDSTADICERLSEKDGRIKVIRGSRGGVSHARNTALDNATGEYIMSVDSDDIIEPDMIKIHYDKLISTGADVVASGLNYVTEEGELLYKRPPALERVMSGRDALMARDGEEGANAVIASPCAKLAKREIYEGKRYKEGIIYEDLHLMPYLYYDAKKFVIFPYSGYYYRQRTGSIMHTEEVERELKLHCDIYSDHAELYREKGDTELEYRARSVAADKILMACRRSDFPKELEKYAVREFKKHYKFLIKHSPSTKEKLKYRLFRYLGVKGYRSVRKKV